MKFVPDSRRLVLVLGMALLLAVPLGVSAAGAGHGSLDPGFGKGGIVTTAVGRPLSSAAAALAIQKDGKLVAAGGAGKGFALVRYNANGSLDRSFGSGGKVTTTIGPYGADASALVIQPDGKLVAAGDTIYSPAGGVDQDPSVHFALVRYQANGSLDRSFGSGGIVTTAIGALALGSHVAALVIRL